MKPTVCKILAAFQHNNFVLIQYFWVITAVIHMLLCDFPATVVSMIQHVSCTATPARSGSVMDVATHLAGVY